jgi:ribosome-associated protein
MVGERSIQTQVESQVESASGADRALARALTAARIAEDNRARDVVILDMRELTREFDYFLLATGASRRQLHAVSEEIDDVLENKLGNRRLGIEGYSQSRWILLDYGDVIVHLFDAETRAYYALEELWGQAKRVAFEPRPCGSASSR